MGPVSPDNVHETGVSLHRGRQGGSSSEREERPGQARDPRFSCPTGRCRPRMFTKQVSRPRGSLDFPAVAAEAEQIERTRRKDLGTDPIRVFVPYRTCCINHPQTLVRTRCCG
jgi:hypothetical protein